MPTAEYQRLRRARIRSQFKKCENCKKLFKLSKTWKRQRFCNLECFLMQHKFVCPKGVSFSENARRVKGERK